jgi:hypothetical protein
MNLMDRKGKPASRVAERPLSEGVPATEDMSVSGREWVRAFWSFSVEAVNVPKSGV